MRQTKVNSFNAISIIKIEKIAKNFNSCVRYIDDVLSLNNSRFGDHLHCIYPNELEVSNTSGIQKIASYLDLHLVTENGGGLKTKLYEKRDDFIFPIANFPFINSNIPTAPAYGVYILQPINHSMVCVQYSDLWT